MPYCFSRAQNKSMHKISQFEGKRALGLIPKSTIFFCHNHSRVLISQSCIIHPRSQFYHFNPSTINQQKRTNCFSCQILKFLVKSYSMVGMTAWTNLRNISRYICTPISLPPSAQSSMSFFITSACLQGWTEAKGGPGK